MSKVKNNNMYNEISELRPYFFSLREFNNTDVSLDMKLPVSWVISVNSKDFPNIKYKQQDSDETIKLLSFVSRKTESGYLELFKCVKSIITYNIDKERKDRLLEEKINELKKLFQEKDLDILESLKFEELYGHKEVTGIGLSDTEGFGEEPIGDTGTQEEVD